MKIGNTPRFEGFDAIDFSSQRETDVSMAFVQAHKLDMDAERLVFVNGQFQPNLSDIDGEAFRLSLLNGDAKQALPAAIAPEIFLHLTEAFSDTTLLIEVDAKHTVAKPIYLMQIESRPQGGMAHHRVHLKVGQSSEVKIVEHLLSACHGNRVAASYSGSRLTMEVSDNAELTHYNGSAWVLRNITILLTMIFSLDEMQMYQARLFCSLVN
ncbi:hypothetical protein OGZ01_03350 [Vibrio harveyi]|nr:hypothetical protein [Vibrio harveyi]